MTGKLTKSDLDAIEYELQQRLGSEPTLDDLHAEGHTETRWLNGLLDAIAGAGRVVTLVIAETIQSAAALIIGIVFAILEWHRVNHGALALGQAADQAQLIAFAVVVANVVHPIYALRQLKGQKEQLVTSMTGRGYAALFWRKLAGKPTVETVDWSHNPVLDLAALVITWSTIALAVYDLVAPLLTSILQGTSDKPGLILVIELLMGLGLSLAGVFFLQAAAHELGVRTLTDQPKRLADLLESKRQQRDQQAEMIRAEITQRILASKTVNPTGRIPHMLGEGEYIPPMPSANGHTANGSSKNVTK